MHVLDDRNQPIEGLYAAGEIIGGAHGQDSMPTCNVGWALTTGRLAGEAISGNEWHLEEEMVEAMTEAITE